MGLRVVLKLGSFEDITNFNKRFLLGKGSPLPKKNRVFICQNFEYKESKK